MKNRVAKQIQRGVTILAVALATLLLFTACAPAPTTLPVEGEKVVEIAVIAPLTGAAATGAQLAVTSQQDYLRYFNEELGIPGVSLKMIWADTARDPIKQVSALRRFVERGVVALLMLEGPTHFKAMVAKDELPMLALGITGEVMYPPGWVYSNYPTEAERFAVMAKWIMENWKEERPPRIAFVIPDVEYAREPLGESQKYAESIGMEWLPRRLFLAFPWTARFSC